MNTAWTDYLARLGATFEETAVRFDAPRAEARAAASGTVAVPLTHLGVIRCQGEDAVAFLHNLLSNDVKKLGGTDAQWSSFNSPKGRMLASLLLWKEADGVALAASADIRPMLQKKLSMYVLRSKVKLSCADEDTILIGVSGTDLAKVLAAAGAEVPVAPMKQALSGGVRSIRLDARNAVLVVDAAGAAELYGRLLDAGAVKAGSAAWQFAMIRAGLPLITAATQEEFVAQMLNFELIGGVSFNKGCYPGQEIVARMQYLGKLKKRMYRVRLAGDAAPAAGADLFAADFGEQSVGKLVNVVPAPDDGYEALAVMQTSSASTGDVHLGAPDGPRLEILDLPYALPAQ